VDLGSNRAVLGLVLVQVADGAFSAAAKEWVNADLEHLRLPLHLRFAFPVIKTASALGLLAGLRWHRLGRVTAVCLVAYFVLAVGAHVRVRDATFKAVPALAMLAWSAAVLRSYPAMAETRNVKV
jgi:hypothetical protein